MDNDQLGRFDVAPSEPAVPSVRVDDGAHVIDFAAARHARDILNARIPDEVWSDVQRAAELVDDLARAGRHVRFDTHQLTGRVVASLCDDDSRLLRRLALDEIVGAESDPTPAA
jgi:hypothetical protein